MSSGVVGWPERLASRYRDEGYWRGGTLGESMRDVCAAYGSRTALVADGHRWTYGELATRIDRLAAGLHRLGVDRGDRAVVQLPNVAEFVAVCFALIRIGAQPVLALPAHRLSEVGYLCEHTGASCYVTADFHAGFDHRQLAAEVQKRVPSVRHVVVVGEAGGFTSLSALEADGEGAPPDVTPVDAGSVAVFLLSGGTTGLPKLIPRTHDDYDYNVRRSAEVCGFDDRTIYLAALPIAHNFAFGCPGVLGTLFAGGTAVLARSPSPLDAFPLIERENVTVTALVPPLALLWMDVAGTAGRDLSSLRLLQVGGAKLSPVAARRIQPTLGCQLQQVFGMAEGLLCYTRLDDPDEIVVNTQGRPMSPADEIRVVDEDGGDVRQGEIGELLTRGPYTLRGYYRAPEHNRLAFTNDGFYRTGDLVRVTPTGHLVVEGRAKDVINRGGEKVSAEEVQSHLLTHPAVRDAAVVGMPDPVLGERSCAYVIPQAAPVPLTEVRSYLRSRGLADYKLPDRVEIVDTFPRTGVGKVSKKALAADVAAKLQAEHRGG